MKNMIFILAFLLATQTLSGKIFEETDNETHVKQSVEIVLTLPFEDLIIDNNGIFVNFNGNLLEANSLKRCGENWMVRVESFCPNGHYIVCRCGGCAISSCFYCCVCLVDYSKPS